MSARLRLPRTLLRRLLPLCSLISLHAGGDDMEVYAPDPAVDRTYLHLFLDLGNVEEDTVICRMNDDCIPPFTSPRVYGHLQRRYAPGAPVTAPGLFLAVLAAVLERPALDELRVAVSIPNHAANPRTGAAPGLGGATFIRGFRSLVAHREGLVSMLGSLPLPAGDYSHALQPREAYLEWLRYVSGGEVALGDNVSGNFGQDVPEPGVDVDIMHEGQYLAPASAGECPRFYSLAFALGPSLHDDDLDTHIAADTGLPGNASLADLLAWLLEPVPGSPRLHDAWLVSSASREEDVGPFADAVPGEVLLVDDPVALERGLAERLSYTLRGDDLPYQFSFVQASGTGDGVLPDVFLTLGAGSLSPDWPGNVKKLGLVELDGGGATAANPYRDQPLALLDAEGNSALEVSGDRAGLLRPGALTFWTDIARLPVQPGADFTPGTDGARVDRGGAGQKIDGLADYADGEGVYSGYFPGDANTDPPRGGYPARQLYLPNPEKDGLVALDADPGTASRLAGYARGISLSPGQAVELVRWLRGKETFSGLEGARRWLLGTVAHSRPVAINYGAVNGYSEANPLVRVFFGSDEGLFHIVENTTENGVQSGREVFAFLAPEVVGAIARRHVGVSPHRLPGYGPDGQPVIRVLDRNRDGTIDPGDGDRAFVYFGLRRGGRSYYALDVSDPTATPRLHWRVAATTGGDFDELGLAFSTPVVGMVNYRGVPEPVLIFAGGYDGGWSTDMTARLGKDASADDDAMGNAIFIVSADTGELVWKAVRGVTGGVSNTVYGHAGLVDSIPSRVAPLRNQSGVIERLYVGDTGGAVWRVDLPENHAAHENHRRDQWFISKVADLGADAGESGGGEAHDRRFFHAPDIVRSTDSHGAFDGVLIQSGDRAHPNKTGVANYLFYIKDRHVQMGSDSLRENPGDREPPGLDAFVDQGDCERGDEQVLDSGAATDCADRAMPSGWKLALAKPGEKGLSSPLVDGGRVFFTTFVPDTATGCGQRAGSGRVYVVSLADGTSAIRAHRFRDLGPGIPGEVRRVEQFLYIPGRPAELYDLDGDGEDDASQLIPSLAGRRYSLYWREPGVDPL